MKKFIALFLCLLMAFCLVACGDDDSGAGSGGNGGGGGNKGSGTKKESSVSFYVNYNSTKIELGADASAILVSLGTPKATSDMGNCGGQGSLKKYTYSSIEIYVLTNGASQTIDQITLLDDSVKTPEGAAVGITSDKVLSLCGKNPAVNKNNNITYTLGSKNLVFSIRDGAVVGIDYRVMS